MLYCTLASVIALLSIWVYPLGSLYMHAWKVQLWLCNRWHCSYDCKGMSPMDIAESLVAQISGKFKCSCVVCTLYTKYPKEVSFIMQWLARVVCNVGISAFKNVLEHFWMSCKTSSHHFLTSRTLHLAAASGKACIHHVSIDSLPQSIACIKQIEAHQGNAYIDESGLLLQKCN